MPPKFSKRYCPNCRQLPWFPPIKDPKRINILFLGHSKLISRFPSFNLLHKHAGGREIPIFYYLSRCTIQHLILHFSAETQSRIITQCAITHYYALVKVTQGETVISDVKDILGQDKSGAIDHFRNELFMKHCVRI